MNVFDLLRDLAYRAYHGDAERLSEACKVIAAHENDHAAVLDAAGLPHTVAATTDPAVPGAAGTEAGGG